MLKIDDIHTLRMKSLHNHLLRENVFLNLCQRETSLFALKEHSINSAVEKSSWGFAFVCECLKYLCIIWVDFKVLVLHVFL